MRAMGGSPLPDKLEELQEVWDQGWGWVVRGRGEGESGGRGSRRGGGGSGLQ